jgi:hypothetical protein
LLRTETLISNAPSHSFYRTLQSSLFLAYVFSFSRLKNTNNHSLHTLAPSSRLLYTGEVSSARRARLCPGLDAPPRAGPGLHPTRIPPAAHTPSNSLLARVARKWLRPGALPLALVCFF